MPTQDKDGRLHSENDGKFVGKNTNGSSNLSTLSKFEQESINEEILNKISGKDHSFNDSFVAFDYEVQFEYDSKKGDYKITDIQKYDVEKPLKSKNIKFEKSSQSESVYFTLNGVKYRVSTHNRPKQGAFGTYDPNSEFDKNIVVSNQKEMFEAVEKIVEDYSPKQRRFTQKHETKKDMFKVDISKLKVGNIVNQIEDGKNIRWQVTKNDNKDISLSRKIRIGGDLYHAEYIKKEITKPKQEIESKDFYIDEDDFDEDELYD